MQEFRALPSVEKFLLSDVGLALIEDHGRKATIAAARLALDAARAAIKDGASGADLTESLPGRVAAILTQQARSNLRPVLNLSGTVLHTNLGRAILAEAAIRAATEAMANPLALEFDLAAARAASATITCAAFCVS